MSGKEGVRSTDMGFQQGYFWEAVFAGYLHDIGKLVQRSIKDAQYESHPELTERLLTPSPDLTGKLENPMMNLLSGVRLNVDAIRTAATYHHEDPRLSRHVEQIKDSPYYSLAQLINKADSLSSGERPDEIGDKRSFFLHNILYHVNSEGLRGASNDPPVLRHIPLSELSDLPLEKVQIAESAAQSTPSKELYEEFRASVGKIDTSNQLTPWSLALTLESALRNYLWCVPSDTRLARRDISLYDHLKTTAALAGAAYRYLEETADPSNADLVRSLFDSGNDRAPFLLVAGDFSGIQNYIFGGPSGPGVAGVAKRLRARSFIVLATVTAAALSLVRKLELSPANLIFDYAGKFYILAHNTERSKRAIAEFEQGLAAFFHKTRFFRQRFVIASADARPADFLVRDGNFSKLLARLEHELEEHKRHAFGSVFKPAGTWDPARFYYQSYETPADLCPQCEMRRASSEEDLDDFRKRTGIMYRADFFSPGRIPCESCLLERYLGEKLPQSEYAVLTTRPNSNIPGLELIEDTYLLMADVVHATALSRDASTLCLINLRPLAVVFGGGSRNLPGGLLARPVNFFIPSLSEEDVAFLTSGTSLEDNLEADEQREPGAPKTFSDMAELGRGDTKLCALKADVDALGYIVQTGIPDISISRYSTFAMMLDLFFSSRLRYLISNGNDGKGYSNVYLVFAGGDDLFLVGHWWEGIQLYADLADEFSRWVGHRGITFSTAIEIIHPRTPVYAFANLVRDSLSETKSYEQLQGSIRCRLLGQIVTAEAVRDIVEASSRSADAIADSQEAARSGLQRIIDHFLEGYDFHVSGQTAIPSYIPHIAYLLARHGDGHGLPPDIEALLKQSLRVDDFENLRRVAIVARLTLFLTRGARWREKE